MNEQQRPTIVADDLIVSMDYTLTVDGEVVDSSEDGPIVFLQGAGNVIPGLETALYGLTLGETKDLTVASKDAYGDIDPTALVEIPRSEFPSEIPLEIGTELQVKNQDGEILHATISAVNQEALRLDFNHPLAGKDLSFHVTITDLRSATEEELEHGHAHEDDEEEEDAD